MSTDDPNAELITATKPNRRAAKLTEDDVRAIRASSIAPKVIAHQYGVKAQTIRRIRKRQKWGHIK